MVRNYKRKTMDRWSKEDLLEALLRIKDVNLTINEAAQQYGISRATLYRQYQKFILRGATSDLNQFRTCGGNPILSKVEEDVLEKTVKDLREDGTTVTSVDIKRICFEYCDANWIPNQFNQVTRLASDDWYYGFLKRHPNVRMPKPVPDGTTLRVTGQPSTPKTKKPKKRSAADQQQKGGSSKRTKKVKSSCSVPPAPPASTVIIATGFSMNDLRDLEMLQLPNEENQIVVVVEEDEEGMDENETATGEVDIDDHHQDRVKIEEIEEMEEQKVDVAVAESETSDAEESKEGEEEESSDESESAKEEEEEGDSDSADEEESHEVTVEEPEMQMPMTEEIETAASKDDDDDDSSEEESDGDGDRDDNDDDKDSDDGASYPVKEENDDEEVGSDGNESPAAAAAVDNVDLLD